MKRMLIWVMVVSALLSLTACGANEKKEAGSRLPVVPQPPAANPNGRTESDMKVRLTVGDSVFIASVSNSPIGRDFVSRLPLALKMKDYAETEKIAYLPQKLTVEGAPAGFDPAVGDLTYYAPWGNLAIFYKDFGYSSGLIPLGRIESGIDKLAQIKDEGVIKIERLE